MAEHPNRLRTEVRVQAVEAALRAEGVVAPREGDHHRWDLEVCGGLLGAARLRPAIEEHGAGKQPVRFHLCPRCSPSGGVLTLLLAMRAAGGARDWAATAFALTWETAFFVAPQSIGECDAAIAIVHGELPIHEGFQSGLGTPPIPRRTARAGRFRHGFPTRKEPAVLIRATRIAAGQEAPVLIDEKNS